MSTDLDIAIVGGGAAGFFAALSAASARPGARITLFEKTTKPLAKVVVSGGGRCNVTHHCFDHELLADAYPRGGEFLKKLFPRFDTRSTIEWYRERGVKLKTEADGRMFPVTDDSRTITDCLTRELRKAGIQLRSGEGIVSMKQHAGKFTLRTNW